MLIEQRPTMNRQLLASKADALFGEPEDPIELVESRAIAESGGGLLVWEGDAATFQFTYVSRNAEAILGYPVERWYSEPAFWAESVVHPDDRTDAVAYCALATAKKAHHEFEYRALRADGSVIWLLDLVRVVLGKRGVAERLRGMMLDVTRERLEEPVQGGELRARPSHAELHALL
jgi:PAS domain S-box-containing protein